MTTARAFCRFAPSRTPNPIVTVWETPGRACISAFVVVASLEHSDRVLLGKVDPAAPWDDLGAMPPAMVDANRDRWMLPSSHLLLTEAPEEAAQRVVREQLAGLEVELSAPIATSDRYPQSGDPSLPPHWDLGYIFPGSVPEFSLRPSGAWSELAFVDLATVEPASFARSHNEVLERVGFRVRGRA